MLKKEGYLSEGLRAVFNEKPFEWGFIKKPVWGDRSLVRVEGLEPTCLAASDPKSDTSANFATPALQDQASAKIGIFGHG
jgi:hypothetical protein